MSILDVSSELQSKLQELNLTNLDSAILRLLSNPTNVIQKIFKPTLSDESQNLIYNGDVITPIFSNYNIEKMTIGGIYSATNAGTYIAEFIPNAGYEWEDGSTNKVSIEWTIAKAEQPVNIDTSDISLSVSNLSKNIVIIGETKDNAQVTIMAADTSIVNVAKNANNGFTVTALKTGTTSIKIKWTETNNFNPKEFNINVETINIPDPILNNNSPQVIQATAKAGVAENFWNVGDKIGIYLNGTVGDLYLNGTYHAFILGFDHNSSIEGGHTIHFQFGKYIVSSSVTDIAFVDSKYNAFGTDTAFRMNPTINNTGGWKDSYMRNTICLAFLSILPTGWKNTIIACSKYSDNIGGGGDIANHVTRISDKIWLLSEFEVQGRHIHANSAEPNYQKQYDYYKNGNNKIKYKHNSLGFVCAWWLRSVYATSSSSFVSASTGGGSGTNAAYTSLGFAPGFVVG